MRAARAAFDSGKWSLAAPRKRKAIIAKFVKLLQDHANELALLETLDMGKPIANARTVDIPAVVDCMRWYGEAIDKIYDEIAPTAKTRDRA